MMKRKYPVILIAPNAFKESLSAIEVAEALARGLGRVFPHDKLMLLPLADGGDGSLDVLTQILRLKKETFLCLDPLGRKMNAEISFSEKNEAFIEMAKATGLHLLKDEEKNAALADSYGTGVLLKEAFRRKARVINLFVGGTASMDCGTGILRALGFTFLDANGREVPPGGIYLERIHSFLPPESEEMPELMTTPVKIFCDVTNPLLGPNGSVRVFGPQKDNGKTDMNALENSFLKFASFLSRHTGKKVNDFPGSGAAGGTPAGLSAFLNVQVLHGAEKILDVCRFDKYMDRADIIITGEGKLDQQSLEGKAPFTVAQKAHEKSKKVIFIGGSVPERIDNDINNHFDASLSIVPGPVSLKESMKNAPEWLERIGYMIGKILTL